ncbi:hypothetical protein BDD12DRAFT_377060 [Trichophaea hybrida]|nr:hypothetical protein BDD12DRAFT_377060 [Trichophaea hybrida]
MERYEPRDDVIPTTRPHDAIPNVPCVVSSTFLPLFLIHTAHNITIYALPTLPIHITTRCEKAKQGHESIRNQPTENAARETELSINDI